MKIWITAATEMETEIARATLLHRSIQNNISIQFLTTGIGMLISAVQLTKLVISEQPDFIIQAGIAGTFLPHLMPAKVVLVKKELFGDMGVVEQNQWKDFFDLGWIPKNKNPFTDGGIVNPYIHQWENSKLPNVTGISVNQITTDAAQIQRIRHQYAPEIETMEGIALHYVAGSFHIPYLQIRAISNIVGERNKKKWAIQDALQALNATLLQLIEQIQLA
jgi:futalosine hydrolase